MTLDSEGVRSRHPRAQSIVRHARGLSAAKLLVATAAQSRPRIRHIARTLLRAMSRDGYISFSYERFGKQCKALLRLAHLDSDLQSALELAVGDCYQLGILPRPDLIVDGGANTGLFSIAVLARWPEVGVVACEPVPHNVAMARQNLALNNLESHVNLLPVAIASIAGTRDFFLREANQGSFDPTLAYQSKVSVPAKTLADVIAGRDFSSLLIKLDIEGEELPVLESFFTAHPPRKTLVVMELHNAHETRGQAAELARKFGLDLVFFQEGGRTAHCRLSTRDWN